MALELVELGSIRGRSRMGEIPPGFKHVEEFVLTFEDPLAKVRLPKEPSEEFLRVVDAMKATSGKIRRGLLRGGPTEIKGLDGIRHQMSLDFSAIGGALSSIVDKVTEVVKTPGVLTSLASAASFIPKIGPQIGSVLASFAPKSPTTTTQAVATSAATSQAFGLPGNIMNYIPASLQQSAAGLIAPLTSQAQAGGTDLLSTVLKSVGSFVSMQTLAQGAGLLGGISGLGDIANLIRSMGGSDVQGAIKAGEEDLRNAAALGGGTSAVDLALSRGTGSKFPWVPVGIAAGGALLLVTLVVA